MRLRMRGVAWGDCNAELPVHTVPCVHLEPRSAELGALSLPRALSGWSTTLRQDDWDKELRLHLPKTPWLLPHGTPTLKKVHLVL